MGKKKTESLKERASIGRERRLALALRAVMDAYANVPTPDEARDAVEEAETTAETLLNELGYSKLVAISTRIKQLTEELTAAQAAGNWSEVARLGKELERAQAGKSPLSPKEKTTEPDSRSRKE